MSSKIALVVPTIRRDSFERFVAEWSKVGLFDLVDLILMEDNPTPTFDVSSVKNAVHLSWKDVDEFSWKGIIPRRSDTVRSFAYWLTWKQKKYDFIMTLDDDCYPSADFPNLVSDHIAMLQTRSRWYNTLSTQTPRGIPYKNVGSRSIVLNHGLWQNVIDYDAPHQLVSPEPEVFDFTNRIVPAGAYFPMCGMNLMWDARITPLLYHLLMGTEEGSTQKFPFDRFGDIWCGIILKKITDHVGLAVSTGTPYIHHDRASNPFTNLRKEANGIEVNEWFWQKIDEIKLNPVTVTADNLTAVLAQLYSEIGEQIFRWDGEHAAYWKRLGTSMSRWASLFTNVFVSEEMCRTLEDTKA